MVSADLLAAGFVAPSELLLNYTFRTMLIGTVLVGVFSGSMGCFLYLRRQALIADVIGHSAVFGVAAAFVIAVAVLGVSGRSMVTLTIGAVISSSLAAFAVNWISGTRLGSDAAMAGVLALFYGSGIVLLRSASLSSLPGRGGIETYIFGNAATTTHEDLLVIAVCGGAALLTIIIGWRAFGLFTFDPVFAHTVGYRSAVLGPVLGVATTVAVVIGVKSVGLILMVAFAIMPAASARQWTGSLRSMVMLAGSIGGAAGAVGSYAAVSFGRVPTGPIVVLVLFTVFLVSVLFAPRRSVIGRAMRARRNAVRLAAVGGDGR